MNDTTDPQPPSMNRGAKAEALLLRFTAEAHRRKWNYDRGLDGDGVPLKSEAFDALHRLGEEMRVELEKLRALPAPVVVPAADRAALRDRIGEARPTAAPTTPVTVTEYGFQAAGEPLVYSIGATTHVAAEEAATERGMRLVQRTVTTTPWKDSTTAGAATSEREEPRQRIAAAMREHYLSSNRDEADADGNLPCRCGDWREPGPMGADEDDWDAHLADAVLAVLPAPADRAAILGEAPDLADRLEAVLTKRYTALGNPFSEMRRQEKGPDGWPASRPVGPHQVAEVLRELLDGGPCVAGEEQPEHRDAPNGVEAQPGKPPRISPWAILGIWADDEAQPGNDTETRCTCADAGDCFAPAGHYANCPRAEQQPKEA